MTSTFIFNPSPVNSQGHLDHILVVIDSAVKDYQLLLAGIESGAKVQVLDSKQDGIAQISEILTQQPAKSLQIIAHGSPGSLQLGNTALNLDNLHTYQPQFQQWQVKEILIYSCEVAAGEIGKTFINQLHQLTGANIAASAHKVGSSQKCGSWELGVKVGEISTTLAIDPTIRQAYSGVLASFDPATNYNAGDGSISVAVGDLDGDGNLDLAVANLFGNNVSVLLGNGDGTFAAATNFGTGSSPTGVAIGDFNNDGNLDLAVSNFSSNNVSVLLGNGTGGFGAATNFAASAGPTSVAIADLNGDGNLDLAVSNQNGSNVSILLGNGTGGFGATTNFITNGTQPFSVAIGDLNGDGNLDLAVPNRLTNNVSVLLGNGTGGFGAATNFATGNEPRSVAIGDLDGDGNLDLAVANFDSNNVSVLLGNGTGGFGAATNFAAGASATSVAIGDLDGDGNLDLAVTSQSGNNVSILLGNGTGNFTAATSFGTGTGTSSVAVGDFNGDSKLDLATANQNSNNVSVLLNTTPRITISPGSSATEGGSDGTFTITLDSPAPTGGLVVNFNTTGSTADNTDYTIVAGTNVTAVTANTFTIAEGQTTATLTVQAVGDSISESNETVVVNLLSGRSYILGSSSTVDFTSPTNFNAGNKPSAVTLKDLNKDGNLDLLTANDSGGNVNVRLGNGDGTFGSATDYTTGPRSFSLAVEDINSDGNLDLLTVIYNSAAVGVRLGNGDGTFGSQTNFTVGNSPQSIAVKDINKDGRLDFITADSSSHNVTVRLGNGNGTFGAGNTFSTDINPGSVALGDLNGDGNLDFITANYVFSTVTVRLGDGTGNFGAANNFSVGANPLFVALGDINKDGKLDLATANLGTNDVTVRLGDGTGNFGIANNFGVGLIPAQVSLEDINGDGKLDLVTANANSNNLTVRLGDGTGNFGGIINFNTGSGSGPINFAVGDLNDDGRLDLVSANNNTNNVSVFLNVTTASIAIINNTAPTVATPITDQTATVNSVFTFQFADNTFNDVDAGDTLTYTATLADDSPLPAWLTFNATTRTFSGTPPTAETLSIKVTATDSGNASVADVFELAINPPNTAPTVANTIADQTATVNSVFNFQFAANTFNDVDANDTLTYIATLENGDPLPAWLTFNATTRTFSGTPPTVGTFSIKVTATDSSNATVADVFELAINPPNTAPTVANTIADQTATVNSVFNFQFAANTFNDVDANDTLTYIATLENGDPLPAWLTFNAVTRTFSGTPTTNGNFNIKVTATDQAQATVDDVFTLAVNPQLQITQLINSTNDIFQISSSQTSTKLKVTLKERKSSLVNELAVFTVDDDNGTINGIAPGATGYIEAAIARSQVIFSAIANIPNGFETNNLTRILEFDANVKFRFALIKNNTFDAVKAGSASFADIIFSSTSSQKITDLGNNAFAFNWRDGSNNNVSEFNDLVVSVQATDDSLPLGTNLQNNSQGEMIDLTGIVGAVSAKFTVNREASYDSFVGFYQVTGVNGGIDINNDGVADLLPGQTGYMQAAVNQRVSGMNLTANNQATATYTSAFAGGGIFVPFIIVNGRPEALLDSNSSNDPAIYFPFLGANADKSDHIRLLGNNIFGFEDLPGLGDRDYNDMIVKVDLSVA